MSVALLLIFLGLMALGVPIAISLGAHYRHNPELFRVSP